MKQQASQRVQLLTEEHLHIPSFLPAWHYCTCRLPNQSQPCDGCAGTASSCAKKNNLSLLLHGCNKTRCACEQDLDQEYEAALERRRKEVEGERLQREQEQAGLLTAITSQQAEASGELFLPLCLVVLARRFHKNLLLHSMISSCC